MRSCNRSLVRGSAICLLAMSAAALAGDSTLDPCKLVTNAEVEQVVGKLKSGPTSGQIERVKTCEYEFVNGDDSFSLWLFPVEAMDRARKQLKDLVPVKGLGEEAFIHHDLHMDFTDLFFRKGNAVLKVSLEETEHSEAQVQTLARKAASRM